MMWVRFPNGQCVQYNTAGYVARSASYSDLYTKKDGAWIAQVPNTCVIEIVAACQVFNPLATCPPGDTETAKELRAMNRLLRKLKAAKS